MITVNQTQDPDYENFDDNLVLFINGVDEFINDENIKKNFETGFIEYNNKLNELFKNCVIKIFKKRNKFLKDIVYNMPEKLKSTCFAFVDINKSNLTKYDYSATLIKIIKHFDVTYKPEKENIKTINFVLHNLDNHNFKNYEAAVKELENCEFYKNLKNKEKLIFNF